MFESSMPSIDLDCTYLSFRNATHPAVQSLEFPHGHCDAPASQFPEEQQYGATGCDESLPSGHDKS